MEDQQSYIDSGVLELFVTGNLPEEEAIAVAQEVAQNKAIEAEVEYIEAALMHLAKATAPRKSPEYTSKLTTIEKSIDRDVIKLERKTPIVAFIGWAASLLLLAGLAYFYTQNQKLEDKLVESQREMVLQEGKTMVAEESLDKTRNLLNIIRRNDLKKVPLGAQKVAPSAYAQVFWDKENNKAYIDVKGLPEPPEGMVYQVWSLTLEPLTPTSLGTLDEYDQNGNQIFELENTNLSEAFGITLEPAGGSPSPNLEQLYTLGVVTS